MIACAVGVALAIGIAKRENDAAVDDPTPGTPPRDVPDVATTPVGIADDVISRVEGTSLPFGRSREANSRDDREAAASHIGLPLDPEAETDARGDASPSHVGEHLDPDDEYASSDTGEVSHIGEYQDPLADE